jgi:hypothetical protein
LRRRRLTAFAPVHEVVLAEEVASALRELVLLDPDCERLVYGMRAHKRGAILAATEDRLEELIGFVAAEANHEPDRRRQRRSTPLSTHLAPQPRPSTAGDVTAMPELGPTGIRPRRIAPNFLTRTENR